MIYKTMVGGHKMDELEKRPETPQEPAPREPEKKNDFDNRRKLM